MHVIQQQLAERYRELRDSRTGPVFFIEHNFSESEIADLVSEVRSFTEIYPIQSDWWKDHSLPLLVVATEIGYHYRGTGTDFWPLLEEQLNSHLGGMERQRIRDFFVAAARKYRGANPPVTPWAEAFHLIAWPITHAVLPIEFHRSLALTLSNLRVSVTGLDDATLYRAIQIAAGDSSARFETLLKDANLIVPVTKSLLGENVSELCKSIVERISNDISSDNVARRRVSVAQRVQKTVSASKNLRKEQPKPVSSIKGTLQLRRKDGKVTLEAFFPRLEEPLASRLRRALRRRRYAPRLWGGTASVPSEQLLSGLPFPLKFTSLPDEAAPLLLGIEELNIDEELRDILLAFDLNLNLPLVFAVGSDNEVGRQIRGQIISGHRVYWLVTVEELQNSKLPKLGELGPYICYELDPKEESSREILTGLGITVRFGLSLAFSGAPSLDRDASIPSFVKGDKRVIVPRQTSPEGVLVELDGSEKHVNNEEIIRVPVTQGDHVLRISNGEEIKEFPFRGVANSAAVSVVPCDIRVGSTELTVQALLSGRITFTIESFAPLEGLELTVEIEASGRRVSASAPLGPLPQIISTEIEPFITLLDDSMHALLIQSTDVSICLRVASLCSRSWKLEHRVRRWWWRQNTDGGVLLMSELGELPFGEVAVTTPHLPPASGLDVSSLDVRLLAPNELEPNEYGGAALFSTFCISSTRTSLEPPIINKPRLVRRRRSKGTAAGLEDLVEGYLRWTFAETNTMIAETRRKQVASKLDTWIAELCCGEAWVCREAEIVNGSLWDLLVRTCNETKICHDPYIQLSENDDLAIARIAVEEIRREEPELFYRIGPPSDLNDEDYESLDLACGRAYLKLADLYRKRGDFVLALELEDGDPGAAPDDWQKVLTQVKAHIELHALAALLLPSNTATKLMSLDPYMLTVDEMADELAGWARSARGAFFGNVPSTDTLKAIIALWIQPETAINLDWRGALDTMIAERLISRSARYLVLRSRQLRVGCSV